MKKYKYILLSIATFCASSCNNFLDTEPKDALPPSQTWKTVEDASNFLTGCYDGWESGSTILYNDCASDFGYNNFAWEGFKLLGNGTMTSASPGVSFYDFTIIRRCNTFLANIDNVHFTDEKLKANMIAQIHAIRAYNYAVMNWWYGGVPIVSNFETAEEAKVPRNTSEEVRNLIHQDIDDHYLDLPIKADKLGYFTRGGALAIRMREALYYGDWQVARDKAQEIIDLNVYDLEPNYEDLFKLNFKNSKEIIMSVQYLDVTKPLSVIGQMYNNGSGGWSSIVPTYDLVDSYEMANGLTKDEPGSGYNPIHPFANRDPRLAKSIYFPGADYINQDGSVSVFNTLDKTLNGADKKTNPDYMLGQDNSSKTGLTWAKYLSPMSQYNNIWETSASPIVFRFAEVLLTLAEAENELNGPSDVVYNALDKIRLRAGMPLVEKSKYGTKETLRRLIQRERAVELAGEGLRRADILRWKTEDGKMLAEKVLNGPLYRAVGTVNVDLNADQFTRATIDTNATPQDRLVEDRVFQAHNRYYPIPQSSRDKNPKLKQNEGY